MEKKKIIDLYIDYQNKYICKFGKKTLVLLEVGSFFEYYAVNNPNEKWNIDIIESTCDILDSIYSIKQKDSKRPYLMAGFPNHSLHKHLQKLMNHGMTVITIEQETHGESNPDRSVTGIYSPGTNIEFQKDYQSNWLCVLSIETFKFYQSKQLGIHIGIALTDLSTGKSYLSESCSTKEDEQYSFDETYRILQIYQPSEILLYNHNTIQISNETILENLDLQQIPIYCKEWNKQYSKKTIQAEILSRSYKNNNNVTIFEYLHLEQFDLCIYSFVALLDYAINHNPLIIKQLQIPLIIDNCHHLLLTQNSIHQLDLIPNKSLSVQTKYNSLLSVINHCSTALGKRLLKLRLLNPITNKTVLQKRYNCQVYLRKKTNKQFNWIQIEQGLKQIHDLERVHRRIDLGYFQFYEFASLDTAYQHVNNIINQVDEQYPEYFPNISKNIKKQLKEFIKEYREQFELSKLSEFYRNKITHNIFKKGMYSELDEIQEEIDNRKQYFTELINKMSWYIHDKKSKQEKHTYIKLLKNERDGYYLELTNRRATLLKKGLSNCAVSNLNLNLNLKINHIITIKNIKYVSKNNKTRLSTTETEQIGDELSFYLTKLEKRCHYYCKELLSYFSNKYQKMFQNICNFIAEMDVLKSGAKMSLSYNYCCPKIKDTKHSFINSKQIRHPIIERIQKNCSYIPNDCNLNNNNLGMLLYGINASGKSSYMKSIGLNLILAQAGFFVAAESFEFSPYTSIFTRISGMDNLFKGHSSFAVEMLELRNILNRCNDHSLILGDELCKGTESQSAVAIVSAGIITLVQKKSQFIFATHLHGLSDIKEVNDLSSVNSYHLRVKQENDLLVYDRKLVPGSGTSLYGLEVCKAMNMNKDFLKIATSIRTNLENPYRLKESHYNKNVILSMCKVCKNKPAEETHHIAYQKNANESNCIGHLKKNEEYNLVPLCKECHKKETFGYLNIIGWIETSQGIKLKYEYIEKKKNSKKKITKSQITIIENVLQTHPGLTQQLICNLLKKEKNISVSKSTLSKIKNHQY